MALRRLSVGLVFLAGCVVGGASSHFAAAIPPARAGAPVTRWEYYCVDTKSLGNRINTVGAEGWELATAAPDVYGAQGGVQSNMVYCFKRPLP